MVSFRFAIALVAGLGCLMAQGESGPAPAKSLTPEQRGDLFMVHKQYREAIEAYGQAPRDNAVIWNKTGIAWHQLGQLDKAKADYERSVKLNPDYPAAHNNLGAVYYARKSYRRAITAYKKAIELMPNAASFHKNLGTAYFARKQDVLSMQEYQEAFRLDPDVFENRSPFGTALEDSTVADRARYHYDLAKIYAKAAKTDLAIQYLKKALEEGFHDKKKLEQDPEFQAMRDLPEFKALLTSEPRVL
jgi:tetratricopeptide (TPR) repeat protein